MKRKQVNSTLKIWLVGRGFVQWRTNPSVFECIFSLYPYSAATYQHSLVFFPPLCSPNSRSCTISRSPSPPSPSPRGSEIKPHAISDDIISSSANSSYVFVLRLSCSKHSLRNYCVLFLFRFSLQMKRKTYLSDSIELICIFMSTEVSLNVKKTAYRIYKILFSFI